MTYKPSEARYSGGGKVKYLVYRSPQPLRSGRKQARTRVKRMYFPANAREIVMEQPGTFRRRTGSTVYGVALHYRSRLPASRASRAGKTYRLPERWAQRTKIVDLPRGAARVRLTGRPPEGPRMAVR
ncbi:MAG: hypothetical protein E6J43_10195 [Chloroflexi bacterium]|nr:MAG: hypothetical protein E6J43_10195 [Chloroflexota bacterium]